MKLPICEADAANGFLCASCQAKLDKGELTPTDVAVANALYKQRGPLGLEKVSVSRAFDLGKSIAIISDSVAGLLIGRHGKVAGALAKELGKPVKVIHRTGDLRTMIEELTLPVRVRGINEIFSPSGKIHRVRFFKSEAPRLPVAVEDLKKVVAYLGNERAEVSFE
jgi:transcription antitermination factor NusA-like protein